MSDPKYNTYAGELRFDDDNIVDVNLEPDTENITVRLNGEEVTGGSGLPEVTSSDNGDVLTVVEGVWAKANPAVEIFLATITFSNDGLPVVATLNKTWKEVSDAVQAGKVALARYTNADDPFYMIITDFIRVVYDPSHTYGDYTYAVSTTEYIMGTENENGYPSNATPSPV